jgi:hypothetical protein
MTATDRRAQHYAISTESGSVTLIKFVFVEDRDKFIRNKPKQRFAVRRIFKHGHADGQLYELEGSEKL